MKVSIVTVCYNANNHIAKCIESVLGQDYGDIEYIIVDGASKDGTIDTVKSYGAKISKFISEPDKGIYNAMNKGVAQCTGEVIGILNADDVYATENTILKLSRHLKNTKPMQLARM